MAAEQHNEFTRAVLLINEHSTQAHGAGVQARLGDIDTAFLGDVVHMKTSGDATQDQARLQEVLRQGDVLCIAGGDRTINMAIGALTQEAIRDLHVPIFPLWCGNGNDLAHILNGRADAQRPSSIMQNARRATVWPISFTLSHGGDTTSHIAATHGGFGATGVAATKLNAESHRGRRGYGLKPFRLAYEGLAIAKAVREAEPFKIKEQNEVKEIVEYTFANGPRMAKFGRPPVKLEAEAFFVTQVADKQPYTIANWLGQLVTGTLPPQYLEKGSSASFTILDHTIGHFDAEPKFINANTDVTVQHYHTPFYALTTTPPQ